LDPAPVVVAARVAASFAHRAFEWLTLIAQTTRSRCLAAGEVLGRIGVGCPTRNSEAQT
jgi:hypothetical protein